MPLQFGQDYHVNQVLTNFSIEYGPKSQEFIADKVFPTVPTEHMTNLYLKWSTSDLRRTDVKRRAPGTEAAKTAWSHDHDTFKVQNYAVRHDIDDQTRGNLDDVHKNLDQRATKRLTRQMMLFKELQWAASYFKPGVWATDLGGVDTAPSTSPGSTEFRKWDNALSTPRKDIQRLVRKMVLATGYKPNFAVMGQDILLQLEEHPAILDMYKYNVPGPMTEDRLAKYLGLPKIYTPASSFTDVGFEGDMKIQDAMATYKWIFSPTSILLGYATASPARDEPTAGACFNWTGYPGGSGGIVTKKMRNDMIASDVIQVETAYDFKVVCPDMAIYMEDVVSPL